MDFNLDEIDYTENLMAVLLLTLSCNLKAFEEYDDVYYTTKEAVSMYDVYVLLKKTLDADWLPYNCTIVEYDIFFKDGEYYYEGEEPDDSVRGERTFEYKEGKLVKTTI